MDRRLRPPRDAALGVIAVLLVVAFLGMCWWQVTRAVGGNTLSWAYVFEWPLFAGYVLYMWRRLAHERHGVGTTSGPGAQTGPPGTDDHPVGDAGGAEEVVEEDEELAAYNRYLASLEESGRRKRW